jgi:predicted short-subunit dehydrogenase-like oxidoreductase (DUF2520 family)
MRDTDETVLKIGVIGAGRLGSSLALALGRSGSPVSLVADSQHEAAAAVAARVPGAQAVDTARLVEQADLVLLTVPDGLIASSAAMLRWRAGQRVVHCSGAVGLDALAPAQAAGALRGCFHPLQTFPERFGDAARLSGIAIGVEADGALERELERWCERLGASFLPLRGVDRARYHAAAVFAGNFVVALHQAAAHAFAGAGLSPELARRALAPLTAASADAIARLPLAEALTGPVARGDAQTVAGHLHALEDTPALRELYVRLSAALLELPLALPAEQRAALEALLSDGITTR